MAESKRTANPTKDHRGFTLVEKWIIWGVFCLLVGLSTHLLIMPAMLIITLAIVRWRWENSEHLELRKRILTIFLFLTGTGLFICSVMLMAA